MIRLRSIALALLCTLAARTGLTAQQPVKQDVVHGRVVGPDTMPLAGATIVVIDSLNRAAPPHQARADAKGAFSLTIEGNGTYTVAVNFLGYAAQRRQVKRVADGSIPELLFKMTQVTAQLGAVRTVAERPRAARSEAQGDFSVGGQTTFLNTGAITGDPTGDLTNALSSIPGITVTPSATGGTPTITAFGIDGSQNSLTLNGLGFGATPPRDGFQTVAITSTYDPSHGGFAGVQQSARMTAGTNFITEALHATFDAPSLQYTTPVAAQLGTRYGQEILSGAISGPIVRDHLFYATSFQTQRRASNLTSLQTQSPASLLALNINPDSVTRLLSSLSATGIPTSVTGVPDERQSIESRIAARVDWIPHPAPPAAPGFFFFGPQSPTQDAYYMQAGGTDRTVDGNGIGATSAPAVGAQATHRDGWAQLTAAKYLPASVLNESTIGFSGSIDHTNPYLALPGARILVASTLPNGNVGLSSLSVGGNSGAPVTTRNWQTELRDQVSWTTWDRRHSVQLTLDGTEDGYAIAQSPGLGSFAFNSLSDFENGIPASFSRTLTGLKTSGHGFTGAFGLGDVWTPKLPTPTFGQLGPTFQYGVRVEANHVSVDPALNPDVESTFGLRTDHVPNTFAVMPMLGFRWPVLGLYRASQGFVLGSRGTWSGGVREYRGPFAARGVDSYLRQTGLPDATQQLFCVGDASPAPNWHAFDQSSSAIPDECANGAASTSLAQTTPPVSLFAPDYQLLESWRPTLSFNYRLNDMFAVTATGTDALNLHVPNLGASDVNFNGQRQFTLPAENNRPVFVAPSSIVPETGTAAWTDSRLSPLFAHVIETRTDLRSESRQLGLTLNYQPFFVTQRNWIFFGSVGYNYADSREQYRGFSGTTDGDPTEIGWSRGAQAKHAIVFNGFLRRDRIGVLNVLARFQSGGAYTPTVIGDINGDGFSNDRAFIFDPSRTADTSIADPISRLLASAPSGARDCLERQLGTIAGRTSCVGPWSMSLFNLQFTPDSYRIGLGNRGTLNINVNNIGAGLDQALHGSSHLHGWGQGAFPDPTLLTVRGFDQTTHQYTYTVNPLFGSSTVARSAFRSPFNIEFDLRMEIGPDRETQNLESLLRPTRTDTVKVLPEATIKQRIARGFNPLDQLILVKDSLKLTDAQIDSMRKVSTKYMATRDSIAGAAAKFLAARHGDYGGEEVREYYHAAGIATYKAFLNGYRAILSLFTPEQIDRAKTVPQTAGLVQQLATITDENIATLLRTPMVSLP